MFIEVLYVLNSVNAGPKRAEKMRIKKSENEASVFYLYH